MTLKHQILMLIVVPLLGVVSFGGWLATIEGKSLIEARSTQQTVDQALALTDLVHTLQVERGQSAGFLASRGANFADQLPGSRAQTDARLAAVVRMPPQLAQRLRDLQDMRNKVDAQALSVPEMAGYYTGSIRMILARTSEGLAGQSNARITLLGAGLSALAEAKEAAGLQRAAGAAGLGSGAFAPGVYKKFMARGAEEQSFLAYAQAHLGSALSGFDAAAELEASGVLAIRALVEAAGPGGTVAGVTGPQWFANATDWIDRLRVHEVALAVRIRTQADADARRGMLLLGGSLALLIAAVGLCSFLGVRILRRFSRAFSGLTNAMERLGRKDFDERPRSVDDRTEIGRLFMAIDSTRDALRSADERLRASNAERVAVIEVLDDALSGLASNELDHRIETPFPQEYEALRMSFNIAVDGLVQTMEQLCSAVSEVRQSSSNLGSSSHDMSRRTESQAASLEETTAALSQLADTVTSSNDAATQANASVQRLHTDASEGRTQIASAVAAMGKVAAVADEMTGIVDMIEGVAFQTNLLALNAGVEAARAGESGKGFAVVAGEVRALAVQATEATDSIKTLITSSTEIIDTGVKMVEDAGRAFDSIGGAVEKSRVAVEHIVAEVDSQMRSITEIRSAMIALDEVTQRNAAMVNENSSLSQTLERQANTVSDLIALFQIDGLQAPQDAVTHGYAA